MPPRFHITAIGEILLRYSVPAGERLETSAQLAVYPAGAEGNVLCALARLGHPTGLVTALPDNPLGRLAAHHLRANGVDLGGVLWDAQGRMGVYYVEFAHPPRAAQVVYDRADSSAAHLQPDQIDWEYLTGSRLVHLTGITAALSLSCYEAVRRGITHARERGVAVSFDVNYRQKLWPPDTAAAALRPLMQDVDVLFCKQADAVCLFGIDGSPQAVIEGLAELTHARQIVVTRGEAGVIGWNGAEYIEQPAAPTVILDRLGAGDALAAGVLHGWLEGSLSRGLRCGVVMAALALSQFGDMVVTTAAELDALVGTLGRGELIIR
jgi:2-dehydro-3-deoxygluconokinase